MAEFQFDHVHLRSPDPEATATFYEKMFGAKVLRSTQQGKPRIDIDLCGQMFFIAPVAADAKIGAAPPFYLITSIVKRIKTDTDK